MDSLKDLIFSILNKLICTNNDNKVLTSKSHHRAQNYQYCFCHHFRPVLKFCQSFGILPLNICHDSTNNCQLMSKSFSLPTIIYWWWLPLYLYATWFTFTIFPGLMRPFFEKTDFYAFVFQICITYSSTTFILIYTRIYLTKFQSIFQNLHQIWIEIRANNVQFDFNHKFKLRIMFVLGFATISCMGYTSWFIYALSLECKPRGLLLYNCFSLAEGLQKVAYAFMPFYQQCVGVLLCCIALVTNSFHLELSKQLKCILSSCSITNVKSESERSTINTSNCTSNQILKIRLLHSRLCQIGSLIGQYFGILSLSLCCTGIIIWICGFYGLILNSENLLPPSDNPVIIAARAFYVIRYIEMYFGLNILISIVIGGQILQNSGSFSEEVIFESNLIGLDADSEYQVLVFIRNLRTNKKSLKAANICSIGLNFLSSGIVHSFTYLIILFQFRTSHS